MRATGDTAGYDRAMLYWRQSIDTYRAGGSASARRDLDDARYWSIYGDAQKCIDFLERAFAVREFLSILTFRERAFESIASEPRYLALRGKVLARVNEERAQIDLPPLDDSYFGI